MGRHFNWGQIAQGLVSAPLLVAAHLQPEYRQVLLLTVVPLICLHLLTILLHHSPIVDLLAKNQNLYQVFTRHSKVKLLHVPQPSYVLDESVLTENEYAILVRGTTFSVITRHNGCVLELDLLSQCWANVRTPLFRLILFQTPSLTMSCSAATFAEEKGPA